MKSPRVFYRTVESTDADGEPADAGTNGDRITLPVLLLHGLAGSGDVWTRSLRVLAKSKLPQPVFAPDMPGYGCSQGSRKALGMDELADWAARFLDALHVERAHVAGHSMGCQVALALARRHPNRVGGLVLAGPTLGERAVPLWRYLAGMAVGSSREPLVYRAMALRMFLQMGPGHYVATVRKMMEDDPLGHTAQIGARCLVLRGTRDSIIPEAAARRLAAALPRGSFCAVEKAAHVVPFSRADEFTRIALEFWAQAIGSDTPSGACSGFLGISYCSRTAES